MTNSVNSGGKDRDFAATLSRAGARPARKSAAHGTGNAGPDGGQLPGTGNFSPPPTMPAATSSTTAGAPVGERAGRQRATDGPGPAARIGSFAGATAAQSDAAANGAMSGRQVQPEDRSAPGASNAAPGAAPDIRGAASVPAGLALSLAMPAYVVEPDVQGADRGAPAGTASAAAPLGDARQDLGLARAVDAAQELAVPQVAAAAGGTATANATAAAAATLTVTQPVTATATAAAAGTATAARGATRAPLTVAAATAANNAATSAPSAGTGSAATPTNIAAWTATDLTPQGATAAAMAAVTGIVADNSAATDSTLAPPTGLPTTDPGAAMNATGMNGAAAPGLPVSAVGSAAATSTAGAVTATAGTAAAEKHTGSDNGDSPTSDASSGSPGVTQLSVNSSGSADVAAAPTVKVAAGVGTPEFGQGLADRVSWMVNNNLSSAKLQVNPPQLGPIEVRISVQGDHAQVWLTSHSAVTRDALQSSSGNLREMLGAQGFGQVSVDISQRNFQDRSAYAQPYEWTPAADPGSAVALSATEPLVPRFSNGAVDAYA
ncbi:MAG: flagellar hook-length control protein FliK [Gammaproteobacteria bacterium]